MGFKKRIAAALLMGIGLTLVAAETVLAHNVKDISADCEGWSVTLSGFSKNKDKNIIIKVDGAIVADPAPFNGNQTFSGALPAGAADDGLVTVSVTWNHDGQPGYGDSMSFEVDCNPEPDPEPTEEPSPEPTEEPTPQPEEECEEEEGEEEGEDEGEGDEEGEEECEEPAPEPTIESTTPPTISPATESTTPPTISPTTPPATQTNTQPATQPVTQPTTQPAPQPVPVTEPVAVESQKNDQKDEVKGIVVTRSDSSAVQAEALPAELAFTGPRDQVSALGIVSMLFLMTGLTLRLLGRRRAVQHSS